MISIWCTRWCDSPVAEVKARGITQYGPHADEVSAAVTFANGTVAQLDTSRIAETRKRGLRAVYADGVVEIDFLTREITNTTPRPLAALEMGDPLGECRGQSFVAAARGGDRAAGAAGTGAPRRWKPRS